MGTDFWIIISLTLYKLSCLAVGLLFSYMGYKLFISGIWGDAGDLDANFGNNKLVLKKGAPGTFFVLFGTIVISFTVWKGLEFNNHRGNSIPTSIEQNFKNNQLPPKLPF